MRGFLEIEEMESTKFLFFSDRDWALVEKKEADSSLRPHERLLLSHLFAAGSRVYNEEYTQPTMVLQNIPGSGSHSPTYTYPTGGMVVWTDA